MRHQVEIRLSRALGVAVHVGGMETNLLTRVQIRDVDVHHRDGSRFLRLKYGRVNYRIWDFLRRDISIRAIWMDSLFIAVRRDSAGVLGIPFPIQQDTSDTVESAPFRIHFRSLNIRHAMISYDDRQIPIQGAIYGIGFECEERENDVYHWLASADSARFMLKEKHLPVAKLNAAGMIGSEHWEVSSLEMKISGLDLSGQASGEIMGRYSTLRGAFSLCGRIDGVTDFLSDALPRSLSSARGELDLKLNLEGRWSHPQFTGEVRIRDTRLGDIIISEGQMRILRWDSLFALEHLKIATLGGRVFGNGYVILDTLMDHRLSLNVQGIEFPGRLKMIHQDSVNVEGVVSGRWISSGPVESLQTLRVESYLNLEKARYRNKTLPDLNIRLSADRGEANVIIAQGENRLEGDLKMKDRRGEGIFHFDIRRTGHLAELMSIDNFSGSFRGGGQIRGDIENPEISMEILGEALRYQNFPMDSLQIYVEYRDGQLFIQNGKFSGQYASKESPRPLFDSAQFRGSFSYRGMISGPVDNPRAEINAKFFMPEFGDIHFDEGDLRIKTMQGQIYLDALTLRKDSLWVMAIGQYRMAQAEGRIDVSVFEGSKNGHRPVVEIEDGLRPISDLPRFGLITVYFDHELNNAWRVKATGMGIHLDKMLTFYREKTDWRGTFGFDLALSGNEHTPQGLFRIWADSVGAGQALLDSVRGTVELREN